MNDHIRVLYCKSERGWGVSAAIWVQPNGQPARIWNPLDQKQPPSTLDIGLWPTCSEPRCKPVSRRYCRYSYSASGQCATKPVPLCEDDAKTITAPLLRIALTGRQDWLFMVGRCLGGLIPEAQARKHCSDEELDELVRSLHLRRRPHEWDGSTLYEMTRYGWGR